jgi:hypothetical protein
VSNQPRDRATARTNRPWRCRCGRCPTGFHKVGVPGSIPGPATRRNNIAGGRVLSGVSYAPPAGCDSRTRQLTIRS